MPETADEHYENAALKYRLSARAFCSCYGIEYVEPEVVDRATWEVRIRAIRDAQAENLGVEVIGAAKRYLQQESGTIAHYGRLPRATLRRLQKPDCLPFCRTRLDPYVYHKGASFGPAGRKWALSVFFLFRLYEKPKPPVYAPGGMFDLFDMRMTTCPSPEVMVLGETDPTKIVRDVLHTIAGKYSVPTELLGVAPPRAPTTLNPHV